jgi:hypothetical protein
MENSYSLDDFLQCSQKVVEFSDMPKEEGLYLVRCLVHDFWTPLYLGMSTNLYNRWKYGHHRTDEIVFLKGLNVPIEIQILTGTSLTAFSASLEKLEILFIDGIKPSLNNKKVTRPIVNLGDKVFETCPICGSQLGKANRSGYCKTHREHSPDRKARKPSKYRTNNPEEK